MNKFSVLISIYNKENPEWFDQALESVFNQTVLPNEIVLIKDGFINSKLESVISKYQNKYPIFKIIQNENNIGLGLSLAKGINASSNEIIARMDTDDIIPPDRFEKQLNLINQGFDVVSSWSQLFIDNPKNVFAIKRRPESHDSIVKLAHRRSPVCHAATIYRKSKVLLAGNYLHREFYEDYNLWIRMIQTGSRFYNVQEVLYYVRTSKDQIKRRSGFNYLYKELKYLKEFYDLNFFTFRDLYINTLIRISARLIPNIFRKKIFRIIWNFQNK